MEPTPQNLERLRWLLEQRDRRRARHPETVHDVPLELHMDNLRRTELEAMAALLGVELPVLLHRYLALGLEADLDAMEADQGPRIGRNPRKR